MNAVCFCDRCHSARVRRFDRVRQRCAALIVSFVLVLVAAGIYLSTK